ncbi:MAG: 30S ribosomal protein S6e [Candidatus Aenigmarchaeota archaeon]|nr:30S ribosomal protein S6e [Candidatus Aenigmarchaeota archaeon]
MTFKVVVSDPKTKKAYQKEVENAVSGLSGKKIGDKFSGKGLGLEGYELEVTGGSDKDGFPMRKDVSGTKRKRVLLSVGPGFHPSKKGERRRKSIRGNTIADDIAQINVKVVKAGTKSIAASFGVEEKEPPKEEKAPAKETPKEKPKEESKAEEKKEPVKEKPKKEAPKEEKPVEDGPAEEKKE